MTSYDAPMWATDQMLAEHWPDSSTLTQPARDRVLTVATTQSRSYAPVLPPAQDGTPAEVPANYELGTIYQARELWNAIERGESDVIGIGDYAIRARPLSAPIKSILRPVSARPGVG